MRASTELSQRKLFDSRVNIEFTPKRAELSWTDQRIEQIKKKYDTTHTIPQWPGSQVRVKTSIQDKQNQRSIVRQEKSQLRNELSSQSGIACSQSNRQKLTEISNIAKKGSQKLIYTAYEPRNLKINEKKNISAFQTDDNFHIKSALNQKLQNQSSGKINHHTSINFFTDYCSNNKSRELASKLSKREVHDSRIENIDKINSKIKHILQCIQSSEQQQFKSINVSQVQQKRSRLNRSNVSRKDVRNESNNKSQLQQTKIIQRKRFYQPAQNSASNNVVTQENWHQRSASVNMRASTSSKHFQQYLNKYKSRLNQHKARCFDKSNTFCEGFMSRSSSCYEKKRIPDDYANQRSSDKKQDLGQIDRQINKFQRKIEELQEKKRKMNIQFKPFEFECSPIRKITKDPDFISSKIRQVNISQRLKTQVQKPSTSYFHQKFEKDTFDLAFSKEKQRVQSKAIYRFIKDSIYPQKVVIKETEPKSALQEKYQNTIRNLEIDQKQSIVLENIQLKNLKVFDNEDLRKKISERMDERKKILERINSKIQQEESQAFQTSNFVKSLCKQVCLDQDLRNSKNWLNQYNNPLKYQLLRSQLARKGVVMPIEQIQAQFNTTNDIQNDPFFSFREEKYTIQSVALSYLDSSNFWQQRLFKKWNFQKMLSNENLSRRLLKKNEITIEDIVRLINTETGNFYRNRDVYLIFQRIKKHIGVINQETISIQELKQVLGK